MQIASWEREAESSKAALAQREVACASDQKWNACEQKDLLYQYAYFKELQFLFLIKVNTQSKLLQEGPKALQRS